MPCSTEFLLYVTVYRLSVLAIGALSIYLGFRLFSRPPGQAGFAEIASSAGVQAGEFKLRVTNFLPGIYFALFGTVLIGIMLWQGPPQMTTQEVQEKTDIGSRSTSTLEMRDGTAADSAGKSPRTAQDEAIAVDQEWAKLDKPGMISAEAAEPLSNIARLWQGEGRIKEALVMAKLAARYGEQVEVLVLFAELLDENGELKKSVQVMQVAVQRDSSYADRLREMQNRLHTQE